MSAIDDILEQLALLTEKRLTLADLPLAALQQHVEQNLSPNANVFLQPHSVGVDALAAPAPWTALPLVNGWAGPAQYYKDVTGVVRLRGTVAGAALPTDAIGVLPPGWRPGVNTSHASFANGAFCVITIDTAGQVAASVGGSTISTSIDNVTFRTEA